ncbi:MAG: type 1 glutamine amidotransferase [Dehalococcoidia bacterium]
MRLTIGYLYPSVMSLYGDQGNITCLLRRCRWRGIEAEVLDLEIGAPIDPSAVDIFFMGGGADSHQRLVAEDLAQVKGEAIRQAVEEGTAALTVCGGYQLWGNYYQPADADVLPGLGIFDAYTVHRAAPHRGFLASIAQARRKRAVGNIVARWRDQTLVGFENHGAQTFLNPGAHPLARVLVGGGNNSQDGTEGAVYKNAIGTYLHGPVLPKNPHLADHLIATALRRRHGEVKLKPLDDSLEMETHRRAVQQALAGRRSPLQQMLQSMPARNRP